MTDSRDFSWHDDAEDVVVAEQAAIAVYLNPKGDVVIRQAGQYGPDEDTVVVVAPCHAARLADAILYAAGASWGRQLELSAPPSSTTTTPKDRTAAERQRRYRERNRNASDRDMPRDGDQPLLLDHTCSQTES